MRWKRKQDSYDDNGGAPYGSRHESSVNFNNNSATSRSLVSRGSHAIAGAIDRARFSTYRSVEPAAYDQSSRSAPGGSFNNISTTSVPAPPPISAGPNSPRPIQPLMSERSLAARNQFLAGAGHPGTDRQSRYSGAWPDLAELKTEQPINDIPALPSAFKDQPSPELSTSRSPVSPLQHDDSPTDVYYNGLGGPTPGGSPRGHAAGKMPLKPSPARTPIVQEAPRLARQSSDKARMGDQHMVNPFADPYYRR